MLLLGQKLVVWTDHKNLTGPNMKFKNDCVFRQRLMLEEYGADIMYIKGKKNVVADALSCLNYDSSTVEEINVFEEEVLPPFHVDRIKEVQSTCHELAIQIAGKNKSNYKEEDGIWKYLPSQVKDRT